MMTRLSSVVRMSAMGTMGAEVGSGASISRIGFARFFLFFLASAVAAAGPLVIATRAVVVVLVVASLEDGVDDMVGVLCWEGWGGEEAWGGLLGS